MEILGNSQRNIKYNTFLLAPILTAVVIYIYLVVPHTGILPDNDYWPDIHDLILNGSIHITPYTLYVHNNEHVIALPKLIYAINIILFGGSNYTLSLAVCVLSLAVGVILARALARTTHLDTQQNTLSVLLIGTLASLVAFTPLAAHNFVMGMSGIAWVGSNLLTLGAMYLCFRDNQSTRIIIVASILCVLAAQCYSTGVPALLLVGIQLVLQRNKWWQGLIIAVIGIILVLVVYIYQPVPQGHGPRTFSPLVVAQFVIAFLGSGLTSYIEVARVWGAAGLVLFSWFFVGALLRQRRLSPAQAFWAAVGGYVIVAGIMAAVGRADRFGVEDAMASRYATVPSLFWAALVGMFFATRLGEAKSSPFRHLAVVAALGFVASTTMLVGGVPRINHYLARATLKPVAALSVYLGARDESAIKVAVDQIPSQVIDIRQELASIGHVPFNGYFHDCPRPGNIIRVATSATSGTPFGFLDTGARIPNSPFVKLQGWVSDSNGQGYTGSFARARCIAITNGAGVVYGLGVAGRPRPDVANHLGHADPGFGWVGYTRTPATGDALFAMAKGASDDIWYPLQHKAIVSPGHVTIQ